ncbi:MAG TPA: AAA family ATPase, partial [Candidatus Paceibacterota bacterium]|nr:AAA family ATPase [Candidatus Paceibacterota bacterium]
MTKDKISAGSFDLNKWLCGGYEKGVITMIAGPPGSGKTNFCILASCSQAKKGNKVIFIDTEGGFSVERIKQIVGEDYENILKNILLLEPTNFEEQKKCFSKLLTAIKEEQVGLIIVDGMAMLYRLELGDAIKSKQDDNV